MKRELKNINTQRNVKNNMCKIKQNKLLKMH